MGFTSFCTIQLWATPHSSAPRHPNQSYNQYVLKLSSPFQKNKTSIFWATPILRNPLKWFLDIPIPPKSFIHALIFMGGSTKKTIHFDPAAGDPPWLLGGEHSTDRKWVNQPWWFQWDKWGQCPLKKLGWTNPQKRWTWDEPPSMDPAILCSSISFGARPCSCESEIHSPQKRTRHTALGK